VFLVTLAVFPSLTSSIVSTHVYPPKIYLLLTILDWRQEFLRKSVHTVTFPSL
jgi:hypothetical protein